MIKKFLLSTVLLFLLNNCAFQTGSLVPDNSGNYLNLSNNCSNCIEFSGNEKDDYNRFVDFLERNNVEIIKQNKPTLLEIKWVLFNAKESNDIKPIPIMIKPEFVNYNNFNFGIVKFIAGFNVSEKYKYTTELRKRVTKLNKDYSDFFNISLDSDQDIKIVSHMTFNKTLKWDDLENSLNIFELGLVGLFAEENLQEILGGN